MLWRDGLPDFSLLWLSEPDLTAHEEAPGSPASLAAVAQSDANLALVRDVLREKKLLEKTNIMVVSDHGFSTITRAVNVPKLLRAAGFDAPDALPEKPVPGQVMIVGNGGSSLFYVTGRDRATIARLVSWLQQSDFAGVILTREEMEGTFPLAAAGLATAEGPDVIVSMRWAAGANRHGVQGELVADAARGVGKGTHASLSRFDVRNVLVAAGPDFARGLDSATPSGNADLAPTILHLLGIEPPAAMDGRVLHEALREGGKAPPAETETRERTRRFESGTWRQYLRVTKVAGRVYLEEGNGAFTAR